VEKINAAVLHLEHLDCHHFTKLPLYSRATPGCRRVELFVLMYTLSSCLWVKYSTKPAVEVSNAIVTIDGYKWDDRAPLQTLTLWKFFLIRNVKFSEQFQYFSALLIHTPTAVQEPDQIREMPHYGKIATLYHLAYVGLFTCCFTVPVTHFCHVASSYIVL